MSRGAGERQLEQRLRAARAAEPAPPPFRRLWAAAERRRAAAGGARLPRAAVAAALLVVLTVAGLLLVKRPGTSPAAPSEPPPLEALAASLSRIETPLDSLLDIPGAELYGSPPPLAARPRELPADLLENLEDS